MQRYTGTIRKFFPENTNHYLSQTLWGRTPLPRYPYSVSSHIQNMFLHVATSVLIRQPLGSDARPRDLGATRGVRFEAFPDRRRTESGHTWGFHSLLNRCDNCHKLRRLKYCIENWQSYGLKWHVATSVNTSFNFVVGQYSGNELFIDQTRWYVISNLTSEYA